MRTVVDIFSGIGGFALGCHARNVQTIAFAETDNYASQVLSKRFPAIPNYGDVRNVPALSAWLLCGGVPCQPTRNAGKRLGTRDARWLWPEALAVVERGRYEWVLFENPDAITTLSHGLEFESICSNLETQDYEVQSLIIPACAVGAWHRRNRVWIIAHSNRVRQQRREQRLCETSSPRHGKESVPASLLQPGWQRDNLPTPRICRGGNDVPATVDRLRCLGNAVVPGVVAMLVKHMVETEGLLNDLPTIHPERG